MNKTICLLKDYGDKIIFECKGEKIIIMLEGVDSRQSGFEVKLQAEGTPGFSMYYQKSGRK